MTRNAPLVLLVLLLLVSLSVHATQPTQQYNKILLTPFYRSNLTNGVNTSSTVIVNPPDGITSVLSAIINYDVWITPTVTFNAWVNGTACNNPTYTISTTFSGAGRAVATFDCTNVIKNPGTYNITLKPTGANTGAVTAWLDFTYMNAPTGEVRVHGTEYVPGDNGKMFLQFLDANYNPVNNSECFIQVWYPNDTIVPGLNYTIMSHLNNLEEGIFYKNFIIPNVTGVYPASAKCFLPLTFNNIIVTNYTLDGFETGNFSGGVNWSVCQPGALNCTNGWDVEDTVPLATIITNASADGPCHSGAYCARYTGSYGFIERGVQTPEGTSAANITFWFKFKGFQTNEYAEFWVFDGNWHLLERIGNAAQYGGYTNNVWYRHVHLINSTSFHLDTFLLGFYATSQTPSTNDLMLVDDVTVDLVFPNITLSNATAYQVLRGAGEVHVSNFYNNLFTNLTTAIATTVWDYNPRNLTSTEDVTNYTLIGLSVWNSTGITIYNDTWNSILQNTVTINATLTNITTTLTNLSMTLQAILALELNETSINLTNITLALTNLQNSVNQVNTTVNGINTTTTTTLLLAQNLTTAISNLQSDVTSIQTDVTNIQTTVNTIKANVTYLISLELNETSVNLTSITNSLNNIQNSINILNTTTNSVLSNLALSISYNDANFTYIINQLNGFNSILANLSMNITGSITGNLTELNNSISGLIIASNQAPTTLSLSDDLLFLILFIIITSLGVFFVNKVPFFGLVAGIYDLLYGLSLYQTSLSFALIVAVIGIFLAVIGLRKART